MANTAAAANIILDYFIRGETPAALTPYLGLFTDVEAETEVSGGSYARVALTTSNFGSAAAAGAITNTAIIAFPQATAGWGEIVGIGVWDAASGGNLLRKAYLISGERYTFSASSGTNTITAPDHDFIDDDVVIVYDLTGSVVPSGLTQGDRYYVVNAATDTLQLSLTQGGAAINITANGAGRIVQCVPISVVNTNYATFPIGTLSFTEPS